jgi:hypothetical protein
LTAFTIAGCEAVKKENNFMQLLIVEIEYLSQSVKKIYFNNLILQKLNIF